MRYSAFNLVRNSLSHHSKWPRVWRDPEPKAAYDVVIVGGGGHGLATAYWLAKNHNITNVAVLEKGWLAGGNVARNTTIVRSDYLTQEGIDLYEFAMKLWPRLSQELNYNVMFSPRGVVKLAHSRSELRQMQRRCNMLQLQSIDAVMLTIEDIKELVPILDTTFSSRFPVIGGIVQRQAGIARHDAVAWGFARGADAYGVDIIQNCEVTGFQRGANGVEAVETTRGTIRTKKVAIATAGHSSVLANMLDLRLPIQTMPLQAFVSEPIKPCLNTVVASAQVMAYVSQSDKGELVIGGGHDICPSYAQRGNPKHIEDTVASLIELFPTLSRLKMMRHWAGIIDITPDDCPIIGRAPVDGVYLNCGWGPGGFKATPGIGWLFASTIANDTPHRLVAPFALERFSTGRLVNESLAAGGYAH